MIASCKSQERDSNNIQDGSSIDTPSTAMHKPETALLAYVNDSTTEFSAFLVKFISDIATQQSSIDIKLRQSHIDVNAEPEPKAIHKEQLLNEVKFPIFPLDSTRQQQKLVYNVDSTTHDSIVVTLQKPDTDYQIKYHFHRKSKWILDWIEDQSL